MFELGNISLPAGIEAKQPVDGKKEYIVTTIPEYIDSVEYDLENDTAANSQVDSNVIPDRAIQVANRRPGSDRQTHYWLTDAEAVNLINDPRITIVEPHPDYIPGLVAAPLVRELTPALQFKRLDGSTNCANTRNFALHVCGNNARDYSTGTVPSNDIRYYDYVLDGRGVDIIIQDSGVKTDHPEWLDPTGTYSRFQQIDWFAAAGYNQSGGANAMPANFYTSAGYHATHCAGIAAGRSFGWAKMANIYSMKILAGDDAVANTTTHNIDPIVSFDLIRNFHLNKPIDPVTNKRRPTLVSASWAYNQYFMNAPSPYNPYGGNTLYIDYQLWSKTYRGTTTATYAKATASDGIEGSVAGTYDLTGSGSAVTGTLFNINGINASADAALQSCLEAGVIFIKAAGNSGHKVEEAGNVDYNNYIQVITGISPSITLSNPIYYHRNASPYANNAVSVGSTYYASINGTNEYRANFSSYGSGVHIFAPGDGITSASTGDLTAESAVYRDPFTGVATAFYQMPLTGTSMACPQVSGLAALYLQLNPAASPRDVKDWIQNQGRNASLLYTTGLSNDYTSSSTIGGGPRYFLSNPWEKTSQERVLEGDLTVLNGAVTLT